MVSPPTPKPDAAVNIPVALTAAQGPNYTQIISDSSKSLNNVLFIVGNFGGAAANLWDPLANAIPGGLLPTFTAGTNQVDNTSIEDLIAVIEKVAVPVPDLSGVPGLPADATTLLTAGLLPGVAVGDLALAVPVLAVVLTLEATDAAIGGITGINNGIGLGLITGIPTLSDLVPGFEITTTTFKSGYNWPLLGLGPILGLSGSTTISNTFAQLPALSGSELVDGFDDIDTSAVPNSFPLFRRTQANIGIAIILGVLDAAIGDLNTPSVTASVPTGQGTYGLPLGGSVGWLATNPTLAVGPITGQSDTDTVVSTPIFTTGANLPLSLASLGFATSPGVVFPTATGVSTLGGTTLTSFSIPLLDLSVTGLNALSAVYIGTNGINFNSGQTVLTLTTPFGALPIIYSLGAFNAGSTGFGFTLPSLFTVGLLPPFQVGTPPTQQSPDGLIPADILNAGLAIPTQTTDVVTIAGLPDLGALVSNTLLTPLFNALAAPVGTWITGALDENVGPLADAVANAKLQVTDLLAELSYKLPDANTPVDHNNTFVTLSTEDSNDDLARTGDIQVLSGQEDDQTNVNEENNVVDQGEIGIQALATPEEPTTVKDEDTVDENGASPQAVTAPEENNTRPLRSTLENLPSMKTNGQADSAAQRAHEQRATAAANARAQFNGGAGNARTQVQDAVGGMKQQINDSVQRVRDRVGARQGSRGESDSSSE